MDEKILKWLYDVQFAGQEIEGFFHQYEIMSASDYSQNILLKKAVERNLEIIGEAINRIVKKDESFYDIIPESRPIIGLRNVLIHAYDGISDEMIWSVVTFHLPNLMRQVQIIISNSNS